MIKFKFISPELCKNMCLKHCNPNIRKRGTFVIMSTTEMKLKCHVLIFNFIQMDLLFWVYKSGKSCQAFLVP